MKNILCYGDSNTYGYDPETGERFAPSVRWTGHLQLLLGNDWHVIEEGCNGRTAYAVPSDAPWKCGRSSLHAIIYSHRPLDMVVLMLGTNDLKTGFSVSADQLAEAMRTYILDIRNVLYRKQSGMPEILLISPPHLGGSIADNSPFSADFDETAIRVSKELAKKYRDVAWEEGCLFLDAADITSFSETDSLHLDPRGHRLLAEAIASQIL